MPELFDNGVAIGVLIFIGAGMIAVARYLTRRGGPVDRVVNSHLSYVRNSEEIQQGLADTVRDHMDADDRHAAKMRRAGAHACDVMDEVAEKLGLSPASRDAIRQIRAELQSE